MAERLELTPEEARTLLEAIHFTREEGWPSNGRYGISEPVDLRALVDRLAPIAEVGADQIEREWNL
ncbi:hypothetical protein [Nocardia nova]|uniref:hypothetical protein n=1 Tax=Nocardia nova TaxID=37330 RepID=UPI001894FE52|nr:hypothetical protein [Nocardia nova]MBF6277040.1 hypothetical protein [Nocardia nova]